jgi:predicted Zn-dependent protease
MSRLEKLQEFLKADPNDSFTRYGIALEYRSMKDFTTAIRTLEELRTMDPKYLPLYYQLADCYRQAGDKTSAHKTYHEGIAVARSANDTHTLSELQAALEEMNDEEE